MQSSQGMVGSACSFLRIATIALSLLATIFVTIGWAQIPQEIPLADRTGVGARAMGMAGAYSAAADDATALYYNPAALARVERIELSAVLTHHQTTKTTNYLGTKSEKTMSPSRISQMGFVYPFPTYRGSFVVGLSYHRITDLDQDYLRRGEGGRVLFEDENIFEEGSLGAWSAGLAWDASPRVSIGAAATLLAGTSYRERRYDYEASNGAFDNSLFIDDSEFSGVTGSVGALIHVADNGRFALTIDLPKALDFTGTASEDVQYSYPSADSTIDVDYIDDFDFEDNMTLPFSVTTGLAWLFGPLLVAGDLQFTDWTQLRYSGPMRTPWPDQEYAYREVIALRLGAEYSPEIWPVRFRAGISRDPIPYKLIFTDVFNGGYETAAFSPERWEFAFGFGALLEESFTIDAAYTHRWYEREGTGIIEGTNEDKIYLGAAFRF
ncbi:MAG: outer membrane protein transport protein [Candidatus Eisenbacteria bacterium]|uniref:Outer membrane protein transport protein n=1 Tax=Eiseniibacteriota bacterium TaxID=2212470 RepID=A0A948RX08_UNCEI|nr:outer membrane protein transport protein [Candidatus Eisenbacteria bacterium]MBU1948917.1 outer membrane protein transport protein [Candidatus Eisenbacteria bacterium]MBU2690597.1 outer membrane protein transport protein [Candidatus Eisenbacteria bacterium]